MLLRNTPRREDVATEDSHFGPLNPLERTLKTTSAKVIEKVWTEDSVGLDAAFPQRGIVPMHVGWVYELSIRFGVD